jgi:hypothetical protein
VGGGDRRLIGTPIVLFIRNHQCRRRSLIKIRSLIAVVIAVGFVVAGCSSASDVPADDGDAGDVILDPAVAVAVSALDAKNSGDLAGMLSFYEGGKNPSTPLHAEEILMNANQRWEVVEPCRVKKVDGKGNTTVECVIHDANDFWGVGGIGDTVPGTFIVNEDLLITYQANIFGSNRRNALNKAFHQWLKDTYPNVYEDMDIGRISENGPGFDTRNPEHMRTAVQYVEEFVAQSDTYPLDPSDQ